MSGVGIRPDALLRPLLLAGWGVFWRDPEPMFSLSDDCDGLMTEYVEPRALLALRGATEGSRYSESAVEERVCCGVAERCVFRRAIAAQRKDEQTRSDNDVCSCPGGGGSQDAAVRWPSAISRGKCGPSSSRVTAPTRTPVNQWGSRRFELRPVPTFRSSRNQRSLVYSSVLSPRSARVIGSSTDHLSMLGTHGQRW